MNSQEPPIHKLGHFKLWKVTSLHAPNRTVTLQRPGEPAWNAFVRPMVYLANPATKVHGTTYPITNPKLHYLIYELDPVDQTRPTLKSVEFENQLTWPNSEKWEETLQEVPWLLVPASKAKTGETLWDPPPGDHFICFTIKPVPSPKDNVTVTDQFKEGSGPTAEVTLTPARICTPVVKSRAGHETKEITYGDDALAIYRFRSQEEYVKPVRARDQFVTAEKLYVRRPEYLAVPKQKHPPR